MRHLVSYSSENGLLHGQRLRLGNVATHPWALGLGMNLAFWPQP